MQFNRTQVAISFGAGALLIVVFLGYLMWLDKQGPVLSRSQDLDPLSGIPNSISLNPLRDRTSERVATNFIRAMADGKCNEQLADWEKDYRKQYAKFICDSEAHHPLVAWKIADWEDDPPLRILRYRGKRLNSVDQKSTYVEQLSVTLENKDGEWVATKYDAMY